MRPALSVWLDFVRFGAALAVFLGHSRQLLAPDLPKVLSVHSTEAVAVFFVISGFVIRYVTSERERTLDAYVGARALRILSVAVPAIILTLVLDAIGGRANPDYYQSLRFWDGPMRLSEALASLAFVNEAWGIHVVAGSNEPYWSLGYEVPYYLLFATLFVTNDWIRWALWLLWALVFGPFVLAYVPLWGMGVLLFDVMTRIERAGKARFPTWLALTALGAPLLYPVLKYGAFPPLGTLMRYESPIQYATAWSYYMLIGGLFSFHLLGFARLTKNVKTIFGPKVVRVIRWCSGATFTVYLMHMPIIAVLAASGDSWRDGTTRDFLAVGAVLLSLFALAEFGERRKLQIRRMVSRMRSARRPELEGA